MKRIFLSFVSIIVVTSSSQASLRDRIKERILEKQKAKPAPTTQPQPDSITTAGDYTFSIEVAGKTRLYKVHVPKKYSSEKSAALLIVLHGGGGDMTIQSTEEYYHQISKSELEGFIALFPNGFSPFASGKLATWNAGKCCGKARDTKSDDVAFIKDAIAKTKTQLNIDTKRIYATGMSNGGMLAYRLACELPDIFRAIAAVAGTDNTLTCRPSKAVSILHVHAKDDDHVLFNGGAGKKAFPDQTQVTDFTSVQSTVEKWRDIDDCKGQPKRILDKKGAYCERYESCKAGTRVQVCVTESGGHSWPGGKKPSRFAGGTPSTAISANDVMWDFFNSI